MGEWMGHCGVCKRASPLYDAVQPALCAVISTLSCQRIQGQVRLSNSSTGLALVWCLQKEFLAEPVEVDRRNPADW